MTAKVAAVLFLVRVLVALGPPRTTPRPPTEIRA
jgi:hypothetical protein